MTITTEAITSKYAGFELAAVQAPILSDEQLLAAFRAANIVIAKTLVSQTISDSQREAALERYYGADQDLSSELISRRH
jgi:hypothetical protein